MRERHSTGAYSAVDQNEGNNDSKAGLANAQQVLSDAHEAIVDFIQARTDSGTENRKKWVLVTMICGLCSITIGSLMLGFEPYQLIFRMKAVFSEGGETFLMWKRPDVNLYLKIKLFNITNAHDYMSGKAKKMTVAEAGPYVYREFLEHQNVTFNSNGTITAYPYSPLEFQPHLSGGSEDDMLMLPNIALLSIAQVISRKSFFTRNVVNIVISQTNSQPIVNMTAKEFMFGYKTKLLSLGNQLMPSWIDFDKLGLIDRMYNFDGDSTTTFTGETDIRLGGLLDNYNRRTTLPQWPYPCNNVSGASDGTKFNAKITDDDELIFYRKSLCRTVKLTKVGEETIGGLRGFQFALKNNSFDNGQYDEENKCYCRKGRCMPQGLLDVADCYYGFPIALSFPHFLDAEPALVEAFNGMVPDKEKHSTSFVINPEAGLPLKVSVKIQINMALEDLSGVTNVKRFSHMYLPMLWLEIEMPKLPSGLSTKFFAYLTLGPILLEALTYIFMTCGVAFILLSLSSTILIPRLTFDSQRKFSPTNWVPLQPSNHKKKPERVVTKQNEMDVYYCSLLNGNETTNGHIEPTKEENKCHFHSS